MTNLSCKLNRTLEKLALSAGAILTLIVTGLLYHLMSSGYDITDEGFYLNMISRPKEFPSITQFGHVYNILYKFSDSNIISLRRVNFLLIYSLSLFSGYLYANDYYKKIFNEKNDQLFYTFLSVPIIAFCSLNFYFLWLTTPNYNSLNYKAILLITIAIFYIKDTSQNKKYIGIFILGLGATLTFLAKPTTTLILVIAAAPVYFYLAKVYRYKDVLVFISSIALSFFIYVLTTHNSLYSIFLDIQLASQNTKLLNSGHSIMSLFRLDPLNLSITRRLILVLSVLTTSAFINTFIRKQNSSLYKILMVIVFSLITLLAVDVASIFSIKIPVFQPHWVYPWLLPASLFFIFLVRTYKDNNLINRLDIAQIFLLIFLPFAYSFGTNNNLWEFSVAASGLCTTLLIFALLKKLTPSATQPILVIFLLLAQSLLSLVNLHNSVQSPYRLTAPLLSLQTKISGDKRLDGLKTSAVMGTTIKSIKSSFNNQQFNKNTGVIDFTGRSPGLVYLTGGKVIGAPWLLGGYPGSQRFASALLSRVPCKELNQSWILYNENQSFAPVIEKLGLNIKENYTVVKRLKLKNILILQPNLTSGQMTELCKFKN